jgi:hypothetical protein
MTVGIGGVGRKFKLWRFGVGVGRAARFGHTEFR